MLYYPSLLKQARYFLKTKKQTNRSFKEESKYRFKVLGTIFQCQMIYIFFKVLLNTDDKYDVLDIKLKLCKAN